MADKPNFENVDEFADIGNYAVNWAKEHNMHYLIFACDKDFLNKSAPGYINFGMDPALLAEMVKVILSDMPPAGVARFMTIFADPRKYHRPPDQG